MCNKTNWLFGGRPETAAQECLRALGNVLCTQGEAKQVFLMWWIKWGKCAFFEPLAQGINDFVYYFVLGFQKGCKTLMDKPKVERKGLIAKLENKMSS